MKKVTIHSPGTVANMVCGFDILGMALSYPYDIMELNLTDNPEVIIKNRDNFGLPTEPEKNVAGVVLQEIIARNNHEFGFELTIEKHIKPGSGLGSSAASAAGAAVAANYLLENRYSTTELIKFAMLGEKLASGVKHADNITPCILGGVTLIRSILPLDIIDLPAPDLFVTVVHPQIEVKTSDARQILRQKVQLKDAIKQWGNIAGLVAGLYRNDTELIGRSMEDVLIEPVRSILIPGFQQVKQRSLDAGALGGGISGSGPSIFMLSKDEETAEEVAAEMKNVYNQIGVEHFIYVTKIKSSGVTIVN